MTAIGCSLALAGVVSSPSRGATALTGVGAGVGDGDGVISGLGDSTPGERLAPVSLGAPLEPAATWLPDGPVDAAGPNRPPAVTANTTPATTTATRPRAIARARTDDVMDGSSSAARRAMHGSLRVPLVESARRTRRAG